MSVLTRFAPSPTGALHVGNARAALFCWLYARAQGGQFMLRMDDTDAARSTAAFAAGIQDDLAWLGLDHDRFAKQSERFARYDAVFEDLRARGLIYACYETPDELERKRKRQLARGKPPVYDRAGLELSADEIAAFVAEGRAPHFRFKLSGAQVVWDDLIRGRQSIETSSLSDPVLRRADGTYLYTLPSVIDDVDFGVTHVIRGEDHVTNTAAQVEIIAAMGAPCPVFAHFSLMLAADGSALSKRLGALSLVDMRANGLEAMSVNSLVARLGTPDPVIPATDLSALVAGFDLARLGRAPAKFDPEDLTRLNAKILHEMPFEAVAARLETMGVTATPESWETLRGNLAQLSDMTALMAPIAGEITPVIEAEDSEYLAAALAALPAEPWDAHTWHAWTTALKETTGRKGRGLFMPLRQALTGQAQGPEMQELLPLIGAARTRARLQGEIA